MKIWTYSWFWGLIGVTVILAVFGIFSTVGWPGLPDDCVTDPNGNCYCEAYVSPAVDNTGVKQPSNTWSGLAPVIFGVIILFWADQERLRGAAGSNPMTSGTFYPIFFGMIIILLGPGSMYFHGSLTRWGGFLDNLSMALFISFMILYNLFRLFRWDDQKVVFAIVYAVVNLALAIPSYLVDDFGLVSFMVLVAVAVIFEIVICASSPRGVSRQWTPWLLVALITFAVASVIWWLSWTGAPLCDPNSWLQGHIFWHILAMGLTPFFVFLYLRSETRT